MIYKLKLSSILIIATLCYGITFACLIPPARGQPATPAQLDVLYAGESPGSVSKALDLDQDTINLTDISTASITAALLDSYNAVVLNDVALNATQVADLKTWAQVTDAGGTYRHGIVIIMGPVLTAGTTLLHELGFTTQTAFLENEVGVKALSVETTSEVGRDNAIVSSIGWNIIPEIANYTQLPDFTLVSGNAELVSALHVNGTPAGNSLLVARNIPGNLSRNLNVLVMAYWLQEAYNTPDNNGQFTLSPMFNYFVFATVIATTGTPLIAYGSWAYSPVPHITDSIVIGIFVAICTVVAIILYKRARKKGQSILVHGEDKVIKEKQESADKSSSVREDPWEEIGFHRQVSGFVKMFFLIMFLVLPQLIVTSIIMPRFLNPYPQATGWYSFTFRFFEGIWLLFDAGFNYAFAKFFAQHRIEHPEKAYHYVQLFVWWEILSGCMQIGLIAFIGGSILPGTNLAYMSWMFITHSLVQYPGFFLVFQYFFQSVQKADYQMISFVLREFLFRLAAQALLVPICRLIFSNQVIYGEAFGAGIGLVLGYQVGDTILFFTTWGMYNGLGLKTAPVFAAQFTKGEFKETFKFGIKIAVGESLVPFIWLLQVVLVAEWLTNASAEQGYFELAWTISQIRQAVTLLTSSMIGALTEATEYKKTALLNYTSSSGWKWGNVWNIFLCSSLWAIGRTFVIGASGSVWARAADLLPWLVLFNLLGPISWQGDQEFSAANKPGYAGAAWVLEQSIRAFLLLAVMFFIRAMEIVLYSYIIALAIKNVFVLIMIRKKIHKWDWNVWPTFVAPGLAGFCNFLVLWILSSMLGQEIVDALILFVVSMFGMVFVYSFFIGFFGGYDTNTLAELDKATKMVTGVKSLARFYYTMAAGGAKISPFHNKFKIKIYEEAMKEAKELTAIKKDIKVVGETK